VSTLGYAILGLLAQQPRTGYEIARSMATPIGYMWTANHSQIYPELAALESDGLVRHRVIEGPGPRDTKRYSLTARGRAALRQWVDSPLPAQPARSELMLRVRCLWLIAPDRARAFIAEVREQHAQRLAAYRAEELGFREEGPALDDPSSPVFAGYATLAWGISYEQHLIDWCDWLLERLAAPIAGE
jgi:DNA-binding PadR family transcriptional regulator